MGLTLEEHKARARLMGCSLSETAGYYIDWNAGFPLVRYDANTLEPLTDDNEIHRRQRLRPGEYKYD
jgi:hypothetical protein